MSEKIFLCFLYEEIFSLGVEFYVDRVFLFFFFRALGIYLFSFSLYGFWWRGACNFHACSPGSNIPHFFGCPSIYRNSNVKYLDYYFFFSCLIFFGSLGFGVWCPWIWSWCPWLILGNSWQGILLCIYISFLLPQSKSCIF